MSAQPTKYQWEVLVSEKQQRQQSTFPKEWILTNLPPKEQLNVIDFPETCGLLSQKEVEITNTFVDELLKKIAGGVWTAVEVTTAFAKRAIIAQQLVNCLTEIFIDKALTRAAALDQHFQKTGKVIGPLHGLPVSLKDQINVKGIESTIGYISWIGQYAEKNSVLVDILEHLGAVPFVKTNVPQTLMWTETFNHIFGRTLNPHNRSLTSGGSSGGEGALVALKGSPLGVGSDIGGSVRIPSGFNGVYGLRPSYGRIPYAGCVNSLEGQDSILSVLGPISSNMSGIKAFMKNIADDKPWLKDPLAVRKPWNEREYQLEEHGGGKQLCFAVLWNDGVVVPHPPVTRGLEEVKEALVAAGHKVIDWKPLKHLEIYKVASDIWGAGAAEDYRVTTFPTNEPLIASMSLAAELGTADAPAFRPLSEGLSAYQLWQVQKKKRELRQEYLDYWQASEAFTGTGRPVDAIISPMAAYTAPPHGMNKSANYTMIWNVLDYPALIIPVSNLKVDPVLDVKQIREDFLTEMDKATYETYDPETFENAPITVQLVGRTLEEEAVIAMGEIVDQALGKRREPTYKL